MATDLGVIERALQSGLVGHEFSGARVLSASVRPTTNPDVEADAVVVELTLTDPAGAATWPTATSDAVRDAARDLLARSGEDTGAITVVLLPEHPDYGVDS